MRKEVEEIAAGLADELVDMEALYRGEEAPGEDDDWRSEDLVDYLNNHALEIYGNARIGGYGNSPDLRQIVIVFGTGGPHREMVIDWQGYVTARAYWGSDSAEQRLGFTSNLFEYLAELVAPEGWEL
jgi:hypothetical protein